MKIKRSYLLLISLISILLCVSAVSATDDVDKQVMSDNSELNQDNSNEITDNNDNTNHKLSNGGNDRLGDENSVDENLHESPEKINTTITSESNGKNLTYNDTVKIDVTVRDNDSNPIIGLTNGSFTVSNGTGNVEFTYENGNITLTNKPNAGLYHFIITFLGNDTYNQSTLNIDLNIFQNIIKTDTSVNVNNHTLDVKIPVNVTSYNGTEVEGIAGTDFYLTLDYDGATEPEVISDFDFSEGNITFTIDSIDKLKNATVTVEYKKDDFDNRANSVKINLNPFIYLKMVPIQSETGYQTGGFKFQIVDAFDNTILINKTITVGGIYFFKFSNVTSSNYNFNSIWELNATLDENMNYIFNSKVFATDGEGCIFIDNLNLYNTQLITNEFVALRVGAYNLTFKSNDAGLILNDTESKKEVNVTKVNAKIIAKDYVDEVGNVIKYIFSVVNADTNEIIRLAELNFSIKLSQTTEQRNRTTNSSGEGYINLNLAPGKYSVTISSRDTNLDAKSVSKTVTVKQKNGVLVANNRTIKYNSDSSVILTFKDKKTGKVVPNAIVNVKIYTGSKYLEYNFLTNSKGQVIFSTPLSVGKHKIVIKSVDTNYTASPITRYLTVKKTSAKFSAPKLTTYYNSGKLFKVKLTNNKGRVIYGATVNIKVFVNNRKYYNVTANTSVNGLIQFYLKDRKAQFKPGIYKVIVSSADKGYSAKTVNSQIKVTNVPTKLVPKKFKAKSGKSFRVKVIHKRNKKALTGVKVKVKLYTSAKKFKAYTIKSDKKGYAYLKIKQKPGKYKLVLSPSNKYYKAKNVKTTIIVIK